jgi:hypothetical protein
MDNVFSFEQENDPLWHQFFPYNRTTMPTDYIDASEINLANSRAIKLAFYLKYLNKPNVLKRNIAVREIIVRGLILKQPIRYIEKTVANCFHLEALEKLFPDALYIHLVRDGRDCISSMMEGWNSGHFSKRKLPLPESSKISHWCYPIPPKWQQVVDKSLEEICAWSWIEHNRYILQYHSLNFNFRHRYLKLSFEDFQENPFITIEKVADFAKLRVSNQATAYLENNKPSWSTVSTPKKNKWKEINKNAIDRITPQILPFMRELGYDCL